MRKKILYFISIGIILSSCTSTYNKFDNSPNGVNLAVNSRIIISTPKDGYYGTEIYYNSGLMTRDSIFREVLKFSDDVKTLDDCNSFLTCDEKNADYFIEPKILHWEDRNTEWSMKPDKITVHITIYNIQSGTKISEYQFSGQSKIFTFGGDHPQDLLYEPISEYISRIFGY